MEKLEEIQNFPNNCSEVVKKGANESVTMMTDSDNPATIMY